MTSTAPELQRLLANPPALHGETTYTLVASALEWIDRQPRPLRTLETGCGLSTIVFAMRGDQHICITPYSTEPDAVQHYCAENGIDAGSVTFKVERSEAVLPTLDAALRDLVLIDGSHAFPQVFIDYFYAARLLAVGGTLIVDDVHLWTGKVLRTFLESEPDWVLETEWDGRTVALRKIQEPTVTRDWFDQPFVLSRSSPWRARARMTSSMLRNRDFATLERYIRSMLPRASR
jgi:predicted O-methyltransferase YrrM